MANPTVAHPVRAEFMNFINRSIERLRAATEPDEHSQQAVEMIGRAMDLFDLMTCFQTRLRAFLPRLHQNLNEVQPTEGGLPAREDPALFWWREFAKMLLMLSAEQGEIVIPLHNSLLEANTFDGLKAAVSEMMRWACTHELSLVEFTKLRNFTRTISFTRTVSLIEPAYRERAFNNAVLEISNLLLMINYSELLLDTLAGYSDLELAGNDLRRLSTMSNDYLQGHFGAVSTSEVLKSEEWIACTENLTATEVADLGEEGCCICKYCEEGDELLRFSCGCSVAFHADCITSFLATRDNHGLRPEPICIHCRQEIIHLPRLPIEDIENIADFVQRLRNHPEDGRSWGRHDGHTVQLSSARAEYGIDGLRPARPNEPEYVRTLTGDLVPARYNIRDEFDTPEGLEVLAGVRGSAAQADANLVLFCGACQYCIDNPTNPVVSEVEIVSPRVLDLATCVGGQALTMPPGPLVEWVPEVTSESGDQESSATESTEVGCREDDGPEAADIEQEDTTEPRSAQEDNANLACGTEPLTEQPPAAIEGLFEIRVDAPAEDNASEPVLREIFRADNALNFNANGTMPRAPPPPPLWIPWNRNRYECNSLAHAHNGTVSLDPNELMRRIRDMPSEEGFLEKQVSLTPDLFVKVYV